MSSLSVSNCSTYIVTAYTQAELLSVLKVMKLDMQTRKIWLHILEIDNTALWAGNAD